MPNLTTIGSARVAPKSRPAGRVKVSQARAAVTRTAPGAHALRVICVDDHMVLVEGLRALFEIDGGIEIVGRLASASRLVDEVERLQPDVVILDIEMPGPDAFEMTDRMKRKFPGVRVVVLSAHIRDAFISASFRSGVCAYFAKSDELKDIVGGIYKVAQSRTGSFLLGPKVSERCRPVSNADTAVVGSRTTRRSCARERR